MTEAEVVQTIQERLSALFDIERIVLFGSRARGDATPDSDYDVLVIANSDVPIVERQGLGLRALGKRQFAVDLLVFTPLEYAAAASIPGTALYWAHQEGRDVYASATQSD